MNFEMVPEKNLVSPIKGMLSEELEDERSEKAGKCDDSPLKAVDTCLDSQREDMTDSAPQDPVMNDIGKNGIENDKGNDYEVKSSKDDAMVNDTQLKLEDGEGEENILDSKDECKTSDDVQQRDMSTNEDDESKIDKSSDNEGKSPMTPRRLGPGRNFFPGSAASESDENRPIAGNGYNHPPYHASPPGWAYYPGYYPPYFPTHLPPHGGINGHPPYYPPFVPPYPPPHNEGPMPPPPVSSDVTQPYPSMVPSSYSYPYYGGYPSVVPPSGGGQQLPMSPLMQQPLFSSPGPSPSAYFASFNSASASNKKNGQKLRTPQFGLNTPPYFPPPSEFGKSETDSPLKKFTTEQKKKVSNGKTNLVSNTQSKRKKRKEKSDIDAQPKHPKRRVTIDGTIPDDNNTGASDPHTDDDLDGSIRKEDSMSVASTSTSVDGNATNPLGLLTYIKPRQPTNLDELNRRSKKNTQARVRADSRKMKVSEIIVKADEERTEEEMNFLNEFERCRGRKNDRSRVRAQENKERVDEILKKTEEQRTKIELQFLESYMGRKQRKNEGDRLRRERLKMLGLDAKKPVGDDRPTITARGPLPAELVERVLKDNEPYSAGDSSPEKDGEFHGHYGYPPHPSHGYPPFGAYHHPPPFWSDHQTMYPPPIMPPSRPDFDERYHSSFSIFPTDKGHVATSSSAWATPQTSTNRKTVVTTDGVTHKKEKAAKRGKNRVN